MNEQILPIIMAFFGTLGFSLYYNVYIKLALRIGFFGMLGYFCYVVVFELTKSILYANLITAAAVTLLSEICARRFKVPTTMLLVPMLFPEIPGAYLYNTVWHLINKNFEQSADYAFELLIIIAALNLGIVLVTACVKIYGNIRDRLRFGRYESYR